MKPTPRKYLNPPIPIGVVAVLLAALAVAALAPQATAAPLFSPKTDFTVGKHPASVTSADFDGDGDPDLATANAWGTTGDTVSVLLGTGDGGFAARTELFKVGKYPNEVTSADFDRDGEPDLATANAFADTVSILLGTGDGGFEPKTDFPVAYAYSVISADFDGDGDPDLATANSYDGTTGPSVSVLLGTGDGAFGAKTDFPGGVDPFSVPAPSPLTSADFDGDGDPDLATADDDGRSVSVLLGTGGGGFGPKTKFKVGSRSPFSVTSADFDGDGNPDLATAQTAGKTARRVSILLGTGDGGFGAKTDFKARRFPNSLTSADFDGDGDLDLATSNAGGFGKGSVSILLGTGDGGFGPKTDFKVAWGPESVTSADFDGDGNTDLATANHSVNSVSILLGTSAPPTRITKRPKAKIKTKKKRAKVEVEFTSEDSGARFRCKLDNATYRPCTSAYTARVKSKPGKGTKHKISVKAKDDAGNVGEAATVEFRVIRKG